MASEMRRAAKALVEPHPQAIKSDYEPREAAARVREAIDSGKLGAGITGESTEDGVVIRSVKGDHFTGRWRPGFLEGEFIPPQGTQRLLKAFAISLTLLFAATAWTFLTGLETSLKVSVGLFTLFAVLAFPYVIVGLSSQREGREAAIARALKRLLEREAR